jgi:DNA-binding CsgD family transcriptional regulator
MTGMSYKEIAAKSFISLDTMYTHTRSIFAKLNVHSRAEISAKIR